MSIELITGPMWSSKTTTLISRIERLTLTGKKAIIVKWSGDDRYGDDAFVYTHHGQKYPCLLTDDEQWPRLIPSLEEYDVIGIDEGMFFHSIVNLVETLAQLGKKVIVSALIGDYRREGFNEILKLIPKCENIIFLTAVCMVCQKDGAAFTQRVTTEEGVELVGGREHYRSVCRSCYFS